MGILTTPPKGMREFTAEQVELRKYVYNTILQTYAKFGFREIETPCIENINLLSSGEGGENEKLMFKILKRGDKLKHGAAEDLADLGLRFDLTVPLSRFYANNHGKLPKISKFIQIGNVWRAERPQKGRYRQLTQCDIDMIGESSVLAELELINATTTTLNQFGLSDFTLKINDRRLLQSVVQYCGFAEQDASKVFIILDKLDKIGISGVQEELLKTGYEQQHVDKLIDLLASFENKSFEEFAAENEQKGFVEKEILEDLIFVMNEARSQSSGDLRIEFDLSLVRGMGYYTGLIFEIKTPNYSWSIAGGGRYDKMVGKLMKGKPSVPACGFSIGFERIVLILEEQGFQVPAQAEKILLIGDKNKEGMSRLLTEANKFRAEGKLVTTDKKWKNVSKQIDSYKAQGFTSFAILREDQPVELKEI
ncbi:MAG: histidine--tRNA ligase [Cytophagales bacterium]|nr:histidine--tRNA ligase [Cytophagales bacterium]